MTLRILPAARRLAASRQSLIRIPPVGKIEEKAVKLHLLCAAALGLAGVASAASAQDSDAFSVISKVSPFCANTGAAAEPLELGELADSDGFVVNAFAGTTSFSLPGYYCNSKAEITLTAAPLLETTSPAPSDPGFTNRVDYTASLVWDDVTGQVESAAGAPATIATAGPNIGDLVVTVSEPETDSNRRPIGGVYAGSVTIKILAN